MSKRSVCGIVALCLVGCGQDGAAGVAGAAGPKGDPGPSGAAGAVGAQGPTGAAAVASDGGAAGGPTEIAGSRLRPQLTTIYSYYNCQSGQSTAVDPGSDVYDASGPDRPY